MGTRAECSGGRGLVLTYYLSDFSGAAFYYIGFYLGIYLTGARPFRPDYCSVPRDVREPSYNESDPLALRSDLEVFALRSGDEGVTGSIAFENSSRVARSRFAGTHMRAKMALMSSANDGKSCVRRNSCISLCLISPLIFTSTNENA